MADNGDNDNLADDEELPQGKVPFDMKGAGYEWEEDHPKYGNRYLQLRENRSRYKFPYDPEDSEAALEHLMNMKCFKNFKETTCLKYGDELWSGITKCEIKETPDGIYFKTRTQQKARLAKREKHLDNVPDTVWSENYTVDLSR